MSEQTGLSERFKEVLDTMIRTFNWHENDRRRLLAAYDWLYNQGERPPCNAVADYLHEKGWVKEWACEADGIWDDAAMLLDIRTGRLEGGFLPPPYQKD